MVKDKKNGGRVFVTGIGIISSIGNNSNEILEALLSGKTGITFPQYIDTIYKNEIPAGEIKLSNEGLISLLSAYQDKMSKSFSRTALLGMIAAKQAVMNGEWRMENGESKSQIRTGLISATSVGGMDRTEIFFNEFYFNKSKGRLRNVIGHDCAYSTEAIADCLGIRDFISTVSTACSSSANSIMTGARLIKNNVLDRAMVGGTDALTRFTINGFNSLQILSRLHCKPFDDNRDGLNLGEGAAYLLLESEELVRRRMENGEWRMENNGMTGGGYLYEVKGYANANDAYHQTASSPEGTGAYLAMKGALDTSGLKPEDITYINTHGTGTANNDLSEAIAMKRVFQDNIPPFSSTKPFTGHTLGAAGAIEAVISILSMKHNVIFPNLNFITQMKETSIKPVTELLKKDDVKNVLSNSFGFGGNNTSLVFSKYSI